MKCFKVNRLPLNPKEIRLPVPACHLLEWLLICQYFFLFFKSQAYLILSIWHCWRNNKFLPIMHHSGIHHDREISKPRSIITEDV